MTKQARAKVSAPSAPVQTGWRSQSRPFVADTQTSRQAAKGSTGHVVPSLPPTRSFGEAPRHSPARFVVQPKLELGPVDDAYEREADFVAAQVVARLSGSASEPRPRAPTIQRLSTNLGTTQVSPEVEAGIDQARGHGRPLKAGIRKEMEQAFLADFSSVRLHRDSRAHRLNKSIQALAFTAGHNIFFRSGHVDPESGTGKEMLAHELAHVAQQTGCAQGSWLNREENKSRRGSTSIDSSLHIDQRKNHLIQRLYFEGKNFDENSISLGNLQTLIVRMRLRGDSPARIHKYEKHLKDREEKEGVPMADRWSERNVTTMSFYNYLNLPRESENFKDLRKLPTDSLQKLIVEGQKKLPTPKSNSGKLYNELKEEMGRRAAEEEKSKEKMKVPAAMKVPNVPGLVAQSSPKPSTVPAPASPPVVFSPDFTDFEALKAIEAIGTQKAPVVMHLRGRYITKNDVRGVVGYMGLGYMHVSYSEAYEMSPDAKWEVHVHRAHSGKILESNNNTDSGTSTVQSARNVGKEYGKLQLSDKQVFSLGIPKKAEPPVSDWFKTKYKEKAHKMGLWKNSWAT